MATSHAPNPPRDIGAFSAWPTRDPALSTNHTILQLRYFTPLFTLPVETFSIGLSRPLTVFHPTKPLHPSMLSLRIALYRCTARRRGIQRIAQCAAPCGARCRVSAPQPPPLNISLTSPLSCPLMTKTHVPTTISHFTKNSHRGVCVFSRRQTSEEGQRGFRLSSFGILLARSVRPRPWRHIAALKALAHEMYASLEQQARGCVREPQEDDWVPAQQFFEERRVQHTDLGAGEWRRWSEELDDKNDESVSFHSFVFACELPERQRFLSLWNSSKLT
jgi:hypothetical protein